MVLRKRSTADIVAEDRSIIDVNAKTTEKLVLLVKDNVELAERLKSLGETLKYLKPSEATVETDKKIGAKLDDLKIELSHISVNPSYRTDSIISEILMLLVNRKD